MTGPQWRATLALVTKATIGSAYNGFTPGPLPHRLPHTMSANALPAWQRRIVDNAYKNRARYLPERKDPARCSRADFMAGYLAFAIENRLQWALQEVDMRATR